MKTVISPKRFEDLSFDEMTEIILTKEPSLSSLERKTLILVRSALLAISRLHVVVDASLDPPKWFASEIRRIQTQFASISTSLEILFSEYKKTPVEAGVHTLPTTEDGNVSQKKD